MAQTFSEDFEGGSNGVAITTSNTGFDSTGGSPVFTNAHTVAGSLAGDFSSTTATQQYGQVPVSGDSMWMRLYFYLPEEPASHLFFGSAVVIGGATRAQVRVRTNMSVQFRNGFAAVWTSSVPAQVGWNRIAVKLDAANQVAQAKLYTGANLHASTSNPSSDSGNVTFDTGAFDGILVGNITNDVQKIIIDEIVFDDSAEPGPADVPNQPPIITYPDDNTIDGKVDVEQSITATAVDNDGSVAAWEWSWDSVTTPSGTQPTLSGDDTATVKFTPDEGGVYRLKVRAQDDNSAWSDYGYVNVAVPGTVGAPIDVTDTEGAAWTSTNDAGVVVLSDNNDETYYQAPSGSTSVSSVTFKLSPFVPAAAFSINIRSFLTAEVRYIGSVTLLEGSQTRKQWNFSQATTDLSTRTLALSASDVQTITDWKNLYLRISYAED